MIIRDARASHALFESRHSGGVITLLHLTMGHFMTMCTPLCISIHCDGGTDLTLSLSRHDNVIIPVSIHPCHVNVEDSIMSIAVTLTITCSTRV